MARTTGGRVLVRDAAHLPRGTLLVVEEELLDGTLRQDCTLETGEECEPIDANSWRVKETGEVLYRST